MGVVTDRGLSSGKRGRTPTGGLVPRGTTHDSGSRRPLERCGSGYRVVSERQIPFVPNASSGPSGHFDKIVIDLKRHREWQGAPISTLGFDGPSRCSGCSENGQLVAEIQRNPTPGGDYSGGRLVLLQDDEVVRSLTEGPFHDAFPEWGPPRTGIVFLRAPSGEALSWETPLQVWFIPEGGRPIRTPLEFGATILLNHEAF